MPDVKTVCALGLFDGVHRGHRLIIESAVKRAEEIGCRSAVFCFETNTVTSKGSGRLEMLISNEDKREMISRLGVDYIFSPDFESFKSMSPRDFAEKILVGRLNCGGVVCGTDFTFGKGAAGKAEDLKSLGGELGFEVMIIPPLKYGGEVISSTEIRKAIGAGEIAKANEMLGYRYGYTLPVEHGYQLGRTWDFPTINQTIPKEYVLPRFGVYCAKVTVDGKVYDGVTNIGVKPTVRENVTAPLAETYIVDFDGDLYGREIKIELWEFVRPERKFGGFEELRAQISSDTEFTKRYFGKSNL